MSEKNLQENLDSFEKKVTFAKQTLEKLSNPEVTLADGMKYYKEGMSELKEASKLLEDAKLIYEEMEVR
jgi:exodeoxyribonuclease VII small subunit